MNLNSPESTHQTISKIDLSYGIVTFHAITIDDFELLFVILAHLFSVLLLIYSRREVGTADRTRVQRFTLTAPYRPV